MIMMIVKRARHGRRPGLVMLQKKKEGLKKDEGEKEDDDDNKSIQGIDFLNRPFHSQMHKELTPGRRQ